MGNIKHDIWQDPEGLTMLCFSGELGKECRTLLEKDSKIIHSFFADSHFDAMTKYYQFMNWGEYTTEFQIDKEEYDLNQLSKRVKLYALIDKILWKDWDPIGVNDLAPRDEYNSYVAQVLNLILNGATVEEVSDRLYFIETKTIGLMGNKLHCKEIAKKIMQEYFLTT